MIQKAYLAGPMSGLPDYNYPKFDLYAKYIREQIGYELVSPHEQGFGPFDPSTEGYKNILELCIKLIATVDVVFVMDGWTRSNGAVAEFSEACKLRRPVYYIKMNKSPGGLNYFDHHYIG